MTTDGILSEKKMAGPGGCLYWLTRVHWGAVLYARHLEGTAVQVTDEVALGRHGAATLFIEATAATTEDVMASMRTDGLAVRRGLVVDHASIKPGIVPLIVFVNRKSGGGQVCFPFKKPHTPIFAHVLCRCILSPLAISRARTRTRTNAHVPRRVVSYRLERRGHHRGPN